MDMKISPSMLACDFANMGAEANKCAAGGAHLLHLDVMDGHFVPNISFGAPVIAGLSKVCDLPFDVHLMISRPLRYIDDYADAGADLITFHLESDDDPSAVIDKILARGCKPAIASRGGAALCGSAGHGAGDDCGAGLRRPKLYGRYDAKAHFAAQPLSPPGSASGRGH